MTTAAPSRLTRRVYLRVKAKLARKRNVLKIASETGVDLQTISAIADGWRPDFPKPGRPAKDGGRKLPDYTSYPTPETTYPTHREASRCPDCGEMVFMPCMACRAERQAKHLKRQHGESKTDLTLDLSGFPPDVQERYDEIHARKIAESPQVDP